MSRFEKYLDEKCDGSGSGSKDRTGMKKRKRKGKMDSMGNMDEASDEKKMQMYRDGSYSLENSFYEFSQNYMRAMGLMSQSESNVNSKYKKMKDLISKSYENMDDAISKHNQMIEEDRQKEQYIKNVK